jgi:hypothetical protein
MTTTTINTDPIIELDPISEARAKADAAASALAELRERVMAGDSKVTPGQIAEAEAAASFAELGIEAAQRRVAEGITAKWLADGAALDAEIAAFKKTDGEALVKHLKAAEVAVTEFLNVAAKRRARNADWQERRLAIDLAGGEPATYSVTYLPDFPTSDYLTRMLFMAAREAGLKDDAVRSKGTSPWLGWEHTYEWLAEIDGSVEGA